jgi:hypothetical protein
MADEVTPPVEKTTASDASDEAPRAVG